MNRQSSAAIVAAVGGVSACLASQSHMVFDLTPLPGLAASPQVAFQPVEINAAGMLGGQAGAGEYHAARWTAAGGTEDLHPTPGLVASWVHDINELGAVVGDGCIPPAGGNGPCGLYLFRNTPGIGNQQLDWLQSGVVGALNAWPLRISNSGAVAMGMYADGPSGSSQHAVFYSDELGWMDLSSLVSADPQPRVQFLDMNDHDQVLLKAGWNLPIYRWSPQAGIELITDAAVSDAVDINNKGQVIGLQTFPSGVSAYRYSDDVGVEQLDSAGAFSNANPRFINDAGMVVGEWSGGQFIYTDEQGMQDLGLPGLISIIGFNGRGDTTLSEHHPQTYVGTPKLKFFGEPVVNVQELIDPAQTQIVVTGIGPINDRRQFAVVGHEPQNLGVQLAFMVQARCAADYDADGTATVPDIFAFLSDWFAGAAKANVNRDADLNVADIFSFLSAWFAGC